ncbi:type II toxin-antitoxin system YafQ family toxin [Alloscardovia venturai]|uniref:Type II toxin-antitoxin system YafQ family toxin n=1 Tax=Alloscardovia venturai TaxID=1769421 RepID=A0ABW2Y1X6_9BIFI
MQKNTYETCDAIEFSERHIRDVKRLKKKHANIELLLAAQRAVISGNVTALRTKFKNHALRGNYIGWRELHVQSDWLLIYTKENGTVVFLRTGSHDEVLKH